MITPWLIHVLSAIVSVNELYARLRRACDSRNYRRVIVEINTCRPMEVIYIGILCEV